LGTAHLRSLRILGASAQGLPSRVVQGPDQGRDASIDDHKWLFVRSLPVGVLEVISSDRSLGPRKEARWSGRGG
jgi:hypothetical protein